MNRRETPLACLLALLGVAPWASADPVTFRAEVPHCTPPGDTVLLRSNRLEAGVFRHDPMTRLDGTRWELSAEVATPRDAFEYKYAHAPCDAARCEGIEKDLTFGGAGDELPPRRLAAGQAEADDRVYVWRDMLRTFDAAGQPVGYRAVAELAAFCGPYLGVRGEGGELALGHDTFGPAEVRVEWGPDAAYGLDASLAGVHRHLLPMETLSPGAEVHYRVVVDGVPGPDRTFLAPPAPGQELRFVHLGDTQYQEEATRERVRALAARALAFRPHLVLGTGDLVASSADGAGGFLQPEIGRWSVVFGDLAPLLAAAPLATAMGNHEEDGAYFWDVFARPLTDPPRLDHFDFRMGHAHFFVLYTGRTAGYDLEGILDSQTAWLEARLQAAAADPTVRWRVVALHRGPYSQGGYHSGEGLLFSDGGTATRPSWRSLWERHGVDLVVAGHNHNFTLAVVNGIRYVTECGGAHTHALDAPWAPSTRYAEETCSLGELTAGPRTLSFRTFRPDGSEIVAARFDLCREDADCQALEDPCAPPAEARWSCHERACQASCAAPEDGGDQDGGQDGQDQDGFEGGSQEEDPGSSGDEDGAREADGGGGGCACDPGGSPRAGRLHGGALALLGLIGLAGARRRRGALRARARSGG